MTRTADRQDGTGTGSAIAHHGELLQGHFEDDTGGAVHAVLSLPQHGLVARALFRAEERAGVRVEPVWRTKAARAAELALHELRAIPGSPVPRGGTLTLDSPLPVGRGQGSSTADVVAAIRATGAAVGRSPTPDTVARLAVTAESASDGVMFGERAVLFANRVGSGYVLDDLGGPLPPLVVLGMDDGGSAARTLEFAEPTYGAWELATFRVLRGMAAAAVRRRNAAWLGRVASASARINQRRWPCSLFDDLERIADEVGAVGVQVAHTGRLAGLLFDPARPGLARGLDDARDRLARLGVETTWTFATDEDTSVAA